MTPKPTLLLVLPLASLALTAADWPSWRGPDGNQVAPGKQFPLTWKWTKDGGSNIRWRTPLPEPGNSSPILVGDHVYLTQAFEDGRRRALLALDRSTGRQLWKQEVTRDSADAHHETNPHCAASPVADAEGIVASFASAGILAVSHEGKVQWKADLGPQNHSWGQGSSPVILGDRVLVFHGPGDFSALHALDRKTGKVLWKTPLKEEQPTERFDGFAGKNGGMMGTFSTPLVVTQDGRTEVVLAAANRLRAFAPADGRELWSIGGMNPLVYTSASFGEGTIVAMGGFFGSSIFVRPGGSGDRTAERLVYEKRAKKHRIGSPILHRGHAYLASTDGFGQCVDLKTGAMVWEERLPATGANGETWASMTLAEDRLYVVNRSGDTLVLRAAPKYELLASNPVGELSNATLAMSNGQIFLRTHSALYCIAEGTTSASVP
jgi:outer membrane protein assembly factor BamB